MTGFARHKPLGRRGFLAGLALALLGGCSIIPKGAPAEAPPPVRVEPAATTSNLPDEEGYHRIALLVPLSGENERAGSSIANAATTAVIDTGAQNIRVTTYDTTPGAAAAAREAMADGNRLILGPLMGENIDAVAGVAGQYDVPVISFSNDATQGQRGVFLMGTQPAQSIENTVRYASSRGLRRIAALVPTGAYGDRAAEGLVSATRAYGATFAGMERYDRGNTSIRSAAMRLRERGGYDAVLIADGGRLATIAAPVLKPSGSNVQILGTELWSGDDAIYDARALRGAWFSAVTDERWAQFAQSYAQRFGTRPFRIATLGFDAVLITLNIANDWDVGDEFPTTRLYGRGGFLGTDGIIRFGSNGIGERAFELREVRANTTEVIEPAPTRFVD
ncbi:penicillin-binding protein activator [Blastomonas marina]|nr:penicillin-binding protein activator [Blastomonas marina]